MARRKLLKEGMAVCCADEVFVPDEGVAKDEEVPGGVECEACRKFSGDGSEDFLVWKEDEWRKGML